MQYIPRHMLSTHVWYSLTFGPSTRILFKKLLLFFSLFFHTLMDIDIEVIEVECFGVQGNFSVPESKGTSVFRSPREWREGWGEYQSWRDGWRPLSRDPEHESSNPDPEKTLFKVIYEIYHCAIVLKQRNKEHCALREEYMIRIFYYE